MKNRNVFSTALIASVLVLSFAQTVPVQAAEAIPELTVFLENQVGAADAAMDNASMGDVLDATPNSSPDLLDDQWYYRRFWMRVRAPAGINVPWILKVQIVPEVELLWERAYPEGWSAYKPR